jgi:hypothetical protein
MPMMAALPAITPTYVAVPRIDSGLRKKTRSERSIAGMSQHAP